MKKGDQKTWIGTVLFHLFVAFTMAMAVDLLLVVNYRALSMVRFAAAYLGCFLLSFLASLMAGKTWKLIAGSLSAAVWMLVAAGFLCWKDVSSGLAYQAVDTGKAELYGGQRVMLLVPHQDDDVNVLGGVIEEYTKYGSEVYIVFSTNGDYYGEQNVRLQEAVDAASAMGVPEEHVIFLGYGDQWDPAGPHIYNARPGEVVRSVYGSTETYGTDRQSVYREGTAYTIDNFLADIESVILEYRPDILYCVDYDYNIDHKALMLSFEKVMGRILNSQQEYRPRVFKGYAYNTAWESEADFYGENLLSTQNIFAEPYLQQPEVYRWEDRVRLPVHGETLSRSVVQSGAYDILSIYASQGAGLYTARVYNSDKVFWERRTDSLCYGADIQASSGDAQLLHNFMLLDNLCLTDKEYLPYDGVWIPDAGDAAPQIQVTFSQPETVTMVSLYDHPDPEKNVLDALITFDDGSFVQTGALHPGGAENRFPVEAKTVTSFTVTLLKTEGEAGLTEVAAYGGEAAAMPFIKLMDRSENFLYDYWISPDGYQEFGLYRSGDVPEVTPDNYRLSCSNANCSVSWQENRIAVECPAGEYCEVFVSGMDGAVSDTVFIQNPGSGERRWTQFWLRAEEVVMRLCEKQRLHERLVICRLYTKIPQKLGSLFS